MPLATHVQDDRLSDITARTHLRFVRRQRRLETSTENKNLWNSSGINICDVSITRIRLRQLRNDQRVKPNLSRQTKTLEQTTYKFVMLTVTRVRLERLFGSRRTTRKDQQKRWNSPSVLTESVLFVESTTHVQDNRSSRTSPRRRLWRVRGRRVLRRYSLGRQRGTFAAVHHLGCCRFTSTGRHNGRVLITTRTLTRYYYLLTVTLYIHRLPLDCGHLTM